MNRNFNRGLFAPLLGLCMILTLGIGVMQVMVVNGAMAPRTADATATSPQWNVTWGLGGTEVAVDVVTDNQGNLYVTGYIVGPSLFQDVFLAKFDQTGELYSISYWGGSGNEQGRSVAVDDDGNAYIAGHTYSFGAGGSDFFVLKFNPEGDLLWNVTWGGTASDLGRLIAVTPDGRVHVCGQTQSFGAGNNDFAILKLSTDGDLLWNRTFGGSKSDTAQGLCVNSDKTIIVSGVTISWGAGGEDICVVAYDKNGLFLWNNSWGGINNDMAYSVDVESTGNYIVTGYTESYGVGNKDVAVVAFNTLGSLLWNATWGGGGNERSTAGLVDLDGNLYIAGYTDSFGLGVSDFAVVKFSSSGVVLWNTTWGGPADDYAEGLERIGDSLYVVGYSSSWSTESENVIILRYLLPLDMNLTIVWVSAIVAAAVVVTIIFLVRRKKER